MDLQGFNANEHEPMRGFEPIPAGKYLAVIVESEEKETNATKQKGLEPSDPDYGSYLELKFQIIEGDYENRNLWVRLNLKNPNGKAVEIARSELSAICRAAGVMSPKVSADLHDLPMCIKVKQKKRADTGEMQNEIGGYEPKEALRGETVQAGGGTDNTPAWKRRA